MDIIHPSKIPEKNIFFLQSPQIWSYKIWDNAYLPSEGTLQENKKCTYPLDSLQYSESMQHHGLGTQGVQQKVFLSS